MMWLGLDIGGANIKAATAAGDVASIPFRFWLEHQRLGDALTELISRFSEGVSICVAATMTAELADCFESRQHGVEFIVECVSDVCRQLDIPPPIFAGTDVTFRTERDAKVDWLKTAASNWAMLAAYASRFLECKSGLIVDMGSTTTDIIPIENGRVASIGNTDSQRLCRRELVYLGVDRTPVCGVVNRLVLDGKDVPIARELFATVGDAMIVSGLQQEDATDMESADGRSKSFANAAERICQMVCEDLKDVGEVNARQLGFQIVEKVEQILVESIRYRRHDPREVIVCGSGQSFARSVLVKLFPESSIKSLTALVKSEVNDVAPAFAVAVLASEGLHL